MLESLVACVHSPGMRAQVVGLTGGIACGKSAASAFFAALGIPVVDADVVARVVVEPGSPGLRTLTQAFGRGVLTLTGALDREKLGALVFADAEKRAMLNGILHPLIAAESMRQIATESAKPVPYVIYDAALLLENGLQHAFPELVVVTAPHAVQLQRLMTRDGFSEEAAEQRIASQMPLADKEKLATLLIQNDSDLPALQNRVREAHETLLERLKARS